MLPISMLTSLSNILLSLELLCSSSSTSTCVLTSLSTFFAAAIKAFKWAVAALDITVDASTVNYAAVASALADVA